MPKRGRSGSQVRRRLPGNSGGRGWHTPMSLPRTPVRGRTMTRAGSAVRSLSSAASRSLSAGARTLLRSNPYTNAAMSAYDAGRSMVNSFTQTKFGSRKGAKFSKSAGRFGGGSRKVNAVDKHCVKGSVQKIETGYVWVDATNQVSYVAQSTAPANNIAKTALASLVKKLYSLVSLTIRSHDSLILEGSSYDNQIILEYKDKDGTAILSQAFAVPRATSTLNTVVLDMFNFFNGFRGAAAGVPDQFLKISLFDGFNSVIITKFLVATLQLTQVKFKFNTASILKIQNRTINSTGNNEADDVDNVPIQGMFYDYKTNGTQFNDYTTGAGTSVLTTSADTGLLPNVAVTTTGTSMYKELPILKQFLGCRKAGKAHLDPGEIKTSVLTDAFTYSFPVLMKILFEKGAAGNIHTQYHIGKTRAFGFEKMINAVAMSSTNQFTLAVEHQVNIGCTIQVKRDFLTASNIVQTTL